jgi:hypothetical protein
MLHTKLKVVDDFVEPALLAHHFKGEVWSYGWRSNTGAHETPFWHIHFCGSRRPDEYFRQDELLASDPKLAAIASVWANIRDQFTPDYQLVRCYANGHTYGLDGHVHRDAKPGEDALTALVYVNPTWSAEWAGETIFIGDSGECEAVIPRPGRLIVFDGTVKHVARSVSRECPALRMTLVFKLQRIPASVSPDGSPMPRANLIEFLRRHGAEASGHSGRSLMEHLVGTWRLLKTWDCAEHVCLAGLFHSIYGTSIYSRRTISRHERAAVRSVVGARAEELAFVFGVLERPAAWMPAMTTGKAPLTGMDDVVLTLDDATVDELLEIEIANLLEQGGAENGLASLLAGGLAERPSVNAGARAALMDSVPSETVEV